MKANEPGTRITKYGLPTEFADRIVERHFQVLEENAALEGGRIAGDIEMSHALSARVSLTVPIITPAPATPAPAEPASAVADDMRARLGLS